MGCEKTVIVGLPLETQAEIKYLRATLAQVAELMYSPGDKEDSADEAKTLLAPFLPATNWYRKAVS